jgi:hypothetical protein
MNDEAQVMKSDMVAFSESVHPSVHGKERHLMWAYSS